MSLRVNKREQEKKELILLHLLIESTLQIDMEKLIVEDSTNMGTFIVNKELKLKPTYELITCFGSDIHEAHKLKTGKCKKMCFNLQLIIFKILIMTSLKPFLHQMEALKLGKRTQEETYLIFFTFSKYGPEEIFSSDTFCIDR